MNSPAHLLQLVLATLLLIASSVLFIIHYNFLAIVLMLAGGVVAFLNFKGK